MSRVATEDLAAIVGGVVWLVLFLALEVRRALDVVRDDA